MNMKRRVGAVLVLGALGPAACGGESGESAPDGATVRDSAGITIVENRTPTRPDSAMWRLAADPELEIGTLEASDEALINVSAARTLSDGRIVVYDNGDDWLRYFSADGDFIRTSGREGEGPGEFNSGISIDVLEGDTVVVDDLLLRRLSYFDAEGDFVRTVNPPGASYLYLSSGADGTLYTRSGTNPMYLGEGNGLLRGAGVITHLDGEGRSLRAVLEFRTSEGIVANNGYLSAAVGRDHFARAHPDGFVLGFADDFHYEVYDFEGNLRRVVRRAGDPAPVTEAERDEFLERSRHRPASSVANPSATSSFPKPTPPTRSSSSTSRAGSGCSSAVRTKSRARTAGPSSTGRGAGSPTS